MKLTGVGPLAGLAYKNPSMDMYRIKLETERADMIARQEAYAVTKDLADMFEVGKVENPYDQAKQTEFAQTRLKEIGSYIQKNPDFRYNPEKYMYVKNMGRELRDNRWTRRSDAYKDNVKQFYEAAKKDPHFMEKKHNIELAAQIKNYNNFGSVNGDDKETEFMYTPAPAWIDDIESDMIKQGNSIENLITQYGTGPGYGSYSRIADPKQVAVLAKAYYTRNKEQLDSAHKGKSEGEILDYVSSRINMGVKTQHNPGDLDRDIKLEELALKRRDLELSQKGADDPSIDYFDYEIMNNQPMSAGGATQISEKFVTDWLGQNGDLSFYSSNAPTSNAMKTITFSNITRGNQVYRGVKNMQGKPVLGFSATADLSVQEAIAKGIAIDENKISDKWSGKGGLNPEAMFIPDPNNKDGFRVRVKGVQLVDPDVDKHLYGSYNQRRFKEGKNSITVGYADNSRANQNPSGAIAGRTKRVSIGGVEAITSDGKTFKDAKTGMPLINNGPGGSKIYLNMKTGKFFNNVTGEEY